MPSDDFWKRESTTRTAIGTFRHVKYPRNPELYGISSGRAKSGATGYSRSTKIFRLVAAAHRPERAASAPPPGESGFSHWPKPWPFSRFGC